MGFINSTMKTNLQDTYDTDFCAWAERNAELLRLGNFSEIDSQHIAEELESMGKSEKRELIHRLAILIAHLLKWKLQPRLRCNSWKYTIKEQRLKITDLLEDSPSLNYDIDKKIGQAYKQALIIAARETGLEEDQFLAECPFNLDQALDNTFFP